ncbi:UNVERIFIED_CONTAM: hypothetical protein FKN15_058284 [Acipenser sinensis]
MVVEMLQHSYHVRNPLRSWFPCFLYDHLWHVNQWQARAKQPQKISTAGCARCQRLLGTNPQLLAAEAIIGSTALHKDRRCRLSHRRNSSPRSFMPQAQGPFSGSLLDYWRQCTSDIWVLATVQTGYSLKFMYCPRCGVSGGAGSRLHHRLKELLWYKVFQIQVFRRKCIPVLF